VSCVWEKEMLCAAGPWSKIYLFIGPIGRPFGQRLFLVPAAINKQVFNNFFN